MKTFAISCAAALLLGGCNVVQSGVSGAADTVHGWDSTTHALGSPMSTVQTFWVLDGISVINTQKTIDDHLVSWVSGKDCSTVRASTGDHYCIDKPQPVPMIARTSYCYKSLAAVNCYDRPLPMDQARFYGTQVDKVPIGQ